MIPAATLAAMQAAAIRTLDKTADIQRNSGGTFTLGQPAENWASILGDPPTLTAARLAQPSQSLMQQYTDVIANQQAWVVSFGPDEDIQARDRVVIAGLTLTVHCSLNPESNSVLNRVLAIRIG